MQVHLQKLEYQSNQRLEVLVPNEAELHQAFVNAKAVDQQASFPYWGKIWPSALAMAEFIESNAALFQDKEVLELAGGLGLPAMVAALYARHVTGSDYQQAAVDIMRQSVDLNGINNMEVQLLDWRMLTLPLSYEIVLISDINYEPVLFEELLQLLRQLQQSNKTIVLATPQRLLARPFMEQLLPLANSHEVIYIQKEAISIVVIGS